MKRFLEVGYRAARRVVVAVVGGTILLIGLAMLVLPGPAVVVLPIGLAVLGLEFAWARRWLRKVKDAANHAATYFPRSGRTKRDDPEPTEDDFRGRG